jgi:O-antigen ligase
MLKEHMFFGAGLGAYPEIFRPYHLATSIEIFQYPHNIFLNFWSETGLLGVGAFIWICITWIRLAWKNPYHRLYLLPLCAILIHGLVDVPYFKNDLAFLFWIFALLATVKKDIDV